MHLALFGTRRAQNPRERLPPPRPRRRLSILSSACPLRRQNEEMQRPRARVLSQRKKRTTKNTHLGGTNAFSPSTLPPCDPGAAAYAWSSKSKLCSLAGVRPGIPYLSSSSSSFSSSSSQQNKVWGNNFLFLSRAKFFRDYFLNIIFRVLKSVKGKTF